MKTDPDIAFESAGLRLYGTYARPDNVDTLPAVLIIAGSGPIDRDSNMPKQTLNIGNALAERLGAAGIASFRFDKRGTGKSEGDYWKTGFYDETKDAEAALYKLKKLHGKGTGPHVVMGHSAGATIALQLAADNKDILDGCILLACSAQKGETVMEWQSQVIADTLSFPFSLFRSLIIRRQKAVRRKILQASPDAVKLGREQQNVRWLQEFMAFEPAKLLPKLGIPTLAITGQKDIQVNYHDLAVMSDLAPGKVETLSPVNLTHLLRDYHGKPAITNYRKQFGMPVSTELSQSIIAWTQKLTS